MCTYQKPSKEEKYYHFYSISSTAVLLQGTAPLISSTAKTLQLIVNNFRANEIQVFY
jgi:hypothetical protein